MRLLKLDFFFLSRLTPQPHPGTSQQQENEQPRRIYYRI
jgi:hypothetical protein